MYENSNGQTIVELTKKKLSSVNKYQINQNHCFSLFKIISLLKTFENEDIIICVFVSQNETHCFTLCQG